MANTILLWKGAVEPASSSPSGNEVKLWKGAVQPAASSSSSLAGILYPRDSMPTDEARFHTFIDDSGITKTGDLTRDYRAALHSVAGLSGNDIDLDLQETFKRYFDGL